MIANCHLTLKVHYFDQNKLTNGKVYKIFLFILLSMMIVLTRLFYKLLKMNITSDQPVLLISVRKRL